MAYSKHRVGIAGLVFVVLVVGVTLLVREQRQSSKEQKLALEMSAIASLYNQETDAFQKKSEKEKEKSDAKSEVDTKADHSNSMSLYADFAKKHPAEPAGWEAAVRAVTYYINEKNNEEAKSILEPIMSHSTDNNINKYPLLVLKFRNVLAGIYVADGNYQKAIDELILIEKIPENPVLEEAYFLHAQSLYLAGRKNEAREMLDKIVISSPGAPGSHIQERAKIWLSYLNL